MKNEEAGGARSGGEPGGQLKWQVWSPCSPNVVEMQNQNRSAVHA